jgi:methyl-accepting chemotaxis protein
MKVIDDMKLGKKMIGGYLIVLLILVVVAMTGYITLTSVSAKSTEMYDQGTVPIGQLGIVSANLQHMRAEIYRYIYVPSSRAADLQVEQEMQAQIKEQLDAYRAGPLTPEEKASLAEFDTAFEDYIRLYKETFAAVDRNDMKKVDADLAAGSPLINSRNKAVGALDNLVKINLNKGKALNKEVAEAATSASIMLIIATILGIIVGVGIALFLTKNITGTIEKIKQGIKDIHHGLLSNKLNLDRKDELGEIADTLDKFSADFKKYIIGTVVMIGDGDFSRNLKPQSDKDEIVPSIKKTIETLRAMNEEANKLSRAAVEGKLAVRGNAEQFKGGYWEIIAGLNKTMDNVVKPLNEGIRVSDEYANGNFTARFDPKLEIHGDYKKFQKALDNIGIQVSSTIGTVSKQTTDLSAAAEEAAASLNEISTGANQIASGTQKVNENAEKSTEGIAQVLKAMEDMSAAVEEVTSSMENVSNQSKQTNDASKSGADLVANVEQSMSEIAASTETVFEIVKEIEKQMADITKIVGLIRDLANQTNLLALNAAIEAARAGDAGRGFAVVASEVKSLAEESRSSAEKIEQMITELNKATKGATTATESAKELVTKGAQMSHEALNAFNKIKEGAEKVASAASEVAAAAEEQAATTEEITASIHEVRSQVEGTSKEASNSAAATEEATASINEINRVVDNLNKIVENVSKEMAKFKI